MSPSTEPVASMGDEFSLYTALRYDDQLLQVPTKGPSHAGWNSEKVSPLYMVDLHRDRLLRAAMHWGWDEVIEKLSGYDGLFNFARSIQEAVGDSLTAPQKVRVFVQKDGTVHFRRSDTPVLQIGNLLPNTLPPPGKAPIPNEPQVPPRFTLVVDRVGSSRSEYTHFKTTNRETYDCARARAGIDSQSPQKEVLIVSENGNLVMEGSKSTPYFWRDGRWVTPPISQKFSRHEGSGGHDGTSRRWALGR